MRHATMRHLLVAMALASISGASGSLAGRPIVPEPSVLPGAADHDKTIAQDLATRDADLVIIGDSIAAHWPPEDFPGRSVLNAGIGGDRTENLLWRLARYQTVATRPRDVILAIGTNDLSRHDSPEMIAHAVDMVARRVRALWPGARLSLIAIPPRGPSQQALDADRRDANARIAPRASTGGYRLVDLDAVLACPATTPACGLLKPDDIHPTDTGYRAMTAVIAPLLSPG